MLLALFVIELAAGFYVFLPLVGRRSAGVKFYRLVLIVAAALTVVAIAAHLNAHQPRLAWFDALPLVLSAIVYFVLRYPKRFVLRVPAVLLGGAYLFASIAAYDAAVRPARLAWAIAGSLSTIALLGSVNLAMTLGHWYLVVRGMPIEPLKRLTMATLVTALAKLVLVFAAILIGGAWHEVAIRQGIFFWMRAGWGLLGPLLLYPMVWGTVKIRSTMAATGILYVDVVAVVIGEVLGGWLSALVHLPV
ncbi:MAG TPA: hypothetical protein VLV78_17225 [Thermoanaerobaculia bacterium]|nr:hypothetical protein [Thermoanaerobaculia bacterium]